VITGLHNWVNIDVNKTRSALSAAASIRRTEQC